MTFVTIAEINDDLKNKLLTKKLNVVTLAPHLQVCRHRVCTCTFIVFMHYKSFMTTAPPPTHFDPGDGRGDSHQNEWGSDQSFATAVWRKYPGFALYRKKGS